jgi:L-aminopeptidase/D-esterase-like protein
MRHLAKHGIGYDARGIRVPIVPGAVIFDLAVGEPVWPDAAMGERAAAAASREVARGRVGAGTGATIGKLLGPENAMRAGLGTASVRSGDAVVGAIAVVNAGGDVVDPGHGRIVAGTKRPTGEWADSAALMRGRNGPPAAARGEHDARGRRLQRAADRRAGQLPRRRRPRRLRPHHPPRPHDCTTATRSSPSAPGEGPKIDSLHLSHLGVLAVEAVERAVLDAVHSG